MEQARKVRRKLSAKERLGAEIVEGMRGLHKIGAVTDAELEKTTMRMLGRDAIPRLKAMTPKQIAALREGAGVSQAVLAAHMNVATSTVSQWERGERHPTGAALKLLHVVKQNGIGALR